ARLRETYETLAPAAGDARLLLSTYFGDVDEAFHTLVKLPVAAIGLDLRRGRRNAELVRRHGLAGKHLVAGVVDGRNVWRADLRSALRELIE
ncbi:MAG: 5-methyltetrahydropteroyltriglutamate--homocysteine S-methyltransferase, partial [Gammaproteobacteria bacterium]|nr:5-methyltetrahydropteroyltriglutamate--homocysteine S-methyltransferase [Gammaproteobacteria bacterium]